MDKDGCALRSLDLKLSWIGASALGVTPHPWICNSFSLSSHASLTSVGRDFTTSWCTFSIPTVNPLSLKSSEKCVLFGLVPMVIDCTVS